MTNLIIIILFLFLGRRLHKSIRSRFLRLFILTPLFTATFFAVWTSQLTTATTAPRTDSVAQLVIEETQVTVGDLTVNVSATGTLQPARQVPLAFQFNAPVQAIHVAVGDAVARGDLLAELDNQDMAFMVADAEIATELQRVAFDALIAPPRDADLAVTEAALQTARAQFNAATQSGSSQINQEIARIQSEIARNRLWQVQMQRDALQPPEPQPSLTLPSNLPISVPDAIADPIEAATGFTIPDPILNIGIPGVDTITGQLNAIFGLSTAQALAAIETQRRQLENALVGLDFGVQVADANFQAVTARGADFGAIASANAQRLQAQLALERLINGATPLEMQRANVEVQLAQLALEQARYNLDQTRLYAPFDGIIAQKNLTIGQLPPQSFALLLMDTSEYYIDLPIDETDIVKIQIGQPVTLQADALPDTPLTGEVVRVAFTPTRIGQVVTYLVRVRLDPTDAPLRVGMTLTAQITVAQRDNALLVPNRFVRVDRTTQTASVVLRDADGSLREVRVLLGERNALTTEITAGLLEGQTIVLLPRTAEGVLSN